MLGCILRGSGLTLVLAIRGCIETTGSTRLLYIRSVLFSREQRHLQLTLLPDRVTTLTFGRGTSRATTSMPSQFPSNSQYMRLLMKSKHGVGAHLCLNQVLWLNTLRQCCDSILSYRHDASGEGYRFQYYPALGSFLYLLYLGYSLILSNQFSRRSQHAIVLSFRLTYCLSCTSCLAISVSSGR
jgi:hypothetical protein